MGVEYVKLVDGKRTYTFNVSTTITTDIDPVDFWGPNFINKFGYVKVRGTSHRIIKIPFIPSSSSPAGYTTANSTFSKELRVTYGSSYSSGSNCFPAPLAAHYSSIRTAEDKLAWGIKFGTFFAPYSWGSSKGVNLSSGAYSVKFGRTTVTKYDSTSKLFTSNVVLDKPAVILSSNTAESNLYLCVFASMQIPKVADDIITNITTEYDKHTITLKCTTTPSDLQYSLDYGETWVDLTELETTITDVEDISFRTTNSEISYLINNQETVSTAQEDFFVNGDSTWTISR